MEARQLNGGSNSVTNFFVAGVGGQGTILASDIIAEVGLEANLDVKKSEIHGMAQRAGSVFNHVRWGPNVCAPVFSEGEADYLLAFEVVEALRWQPMLRKRGVAIVSKRRIFSLTVALGMQAYPEDSVLQAEFAAADQRLIAVDAESMATGLGDIRVANSILLGVLSNFLPISVELWQDVLDRRIPSKMLKLNLEAFRQGREALEC